MLQTAASTWQVFGALPSGAQRTHTLGWGEGLEGRWVGALGIRWGSAPSVSKMPLEPGTLGPKCPSGFSPVVGTTSVEVVAEGLWEIPGL